MSKLSTQPARAQKKVPLLLRLLPFVADLRVLNSQIIKADLLAGISVALIAVPQVMGYAVIAGVPPQYGLYAMTFAVMVAALWGSSSYLVAGPTNAISIILFATIAQASIGGVVLADLPVQEMMPYVFCIAVLAGFIQLLMGLASMGSLANYISHAVMTGFSTGAALLIFSGQLKNILYLDIHGANFFSTIIDVAQNIPNVSYLSLSLGLLSIAVVIISKRVSKHIPAYLCALIVTSVVAYIFGLQSKGLAFVAPISGEFPPFSMPISLDLDILRDIFDPALAIAMLATVESVTIGKNLASRSNSHIDANRELIGQGLGNIVAGFSSGMPGCGSFSRSSLNFSSGARTRFASFFTGLVTLPVIIFFAPLAENIPMAALAGILIYIAYNAIDVASVRLCLVATKSDRIVFIVTVLACLLIDLEKAVFLGVILSLALFVYEEAHPRIKRVNKDEIHYEEFKWMKDYPGFEVFFVEGTLFFGAIANIEEQIQEDIANTKLVLLNLSRVFRVDAAGAHALGQFAKQCKKAGIVLIIVTSDESVCGVLERSKVFAGENIVFSDLDAGFMYAHTLLEQMVEETAKESL